MGGELTARALTFVPAAEGRPLLAGRMLLKVSGQETDDAYTLCLGVTPPGLGPPLHVHETADQTHYVLEGTYELIAGPDVATVGRGSCVHMPRCIPHTFRNVGDETAELIEFTLPGGIDRYFDDVEHLSPFATDIEARNAVGKPYGISFPDDPEAYLDPAPGEDLRPVVLVRAGEGTRAHAGGYEETRIIETDDAGGLHSLTEYALPPGATAEVTAPGPIALVGLDGALTVSADGETAQARRGDTVAAAAGIGVTVTAGDEPVRFIVYALEA